MMNKSNFAIISTSFLIILQLTLPFVGAQNSHFNQDMIKVESGLILQYDLEYVNQYYYIDHGVPDFDLSIDNETRKIIEVDYDTGFLVIIQLRCPSVEYCSFEYNSTMDTFGEIAIYVNWEYWKNNISANNAQLNPVPEDEAPFDITIIDDSENFGYFIIQNYEVDTFGRISTHYNEKKVLYSKVYGVKIEEYYSTTETGPNGRTEYNYRSYILTTDLNVLTELDTQGLFKLIFVLGMVIILAIIILKYRKSKRD